MRLPQELYDKILSWTDFQTAVSMGNVYAISRTFIPKIHDCGWAARNGHLEVLKWLLENRPEACTKKAMICAARNGHLDMVKLLHENRPQRVYTVAGIAMAGAAICGHLEVVRFLYEMYEHCSCSDRMMRNNRHLDVVEFLHANFVNCGGFYRRRKPVQIHLDAKASAFTTSKLR